jgi:hypothetical protein
MANWRFIKMAGALAILLAGLLAGSPQAKAGSGTIQMEIVKAALIVGASGGKGTLTYEGVSYPLSLGGLSAGWQIALSKATLTGSVQNINSPQDIEGVFSAAGAGLAVAAGGKAAVMVNGKGVTIEVAGTQMGVDFSLNLEGLSIKLKR